MIATTGSLPCAMTVGAEHLIHVTFKVELDAGGGDPDRTSPTLRRLNRHLVEVVSPNDFDGWLRNS